MSKKQIYLVIVILVAAALTVTWYVRRGRLEYTAYAESSRHYVLIAALKCEHQLGTDLKAEFGGEVLP